MQCWFPYWQFLYAKARMSTWVWIKVRCSTHCLRFAYCPARFLFLLSFWETEFSNLKFLYFLIFKMLYFFLLIQLMLFEVSIAIVAQTCIWRDGSIATNFLPCGNSTATTGSCCLSGESCLGSGLCYGSIGLVYRGACINTWGGDCPTYCDDGKYILILQDTSLLTEIP